jgi:hypothetical protein
MRFVSATFLVQKAPALRKIEGFTAVNILQEYHRVCDTTLRAHNKPLQIARLLRLRITNLYVFIDGEGE